MILVRTGCRLSRSSEPSLPELRVSCLWQQFASAGKHVMKHFRGQSARIGVVTAAVVRVEDPEAVIDQVFRRVAKFVVGLPVTDSLNNGTVSNSTQREHDRVHRQRVKFIRENITSCAP